VKQYRPAIDTITYDFPVGTVESVEASLSAVKRELQDETVHIANN
jgi:hypothetical protein